MDPNGSIVGFGEFFDGVEEDLTPNFSGESPIVENGVVLEIELKPPFMNWEMLSRWGRWAGANSSAGHSGDAPIQTVSGRERHL
jgi:hypothetical protein